MNLLELAAIASLGTGAATGWAVARMATMSPWGAVALALGGAATGLVVYGLTAYVAVRVSTHTEKTGNQAAVTARGVASLLLVGSSPVVTWYAVANMLLPVARWLAGG